MSIPVSIFTTSMEEYIFWNATYDCHLWLQGWMCCSCHIATNVCYLFSGLNAWHSGWSKVKPSSVTLNCRPGLKTLESQSHVSNPSTISLGSHGMLKQRPSPASHNGQEQEQEQEQVLCHYIHWWNQATSTWTWRQVRRSARLHGKFWCRRYRRETITP